MPDPIIADTPFGQTPSWPPSPALLDRQLNAQNNKIINVDWSGDPINLSTDVTGKLPYANIQDVTAQRLLGRDSGTGTVQEIIIGSNLTLTGGTLSAATSGGAGTGDFSTNTSTSVVNEIVLFSNTTGKQGKRSTGTGTCRLDSGVLSVGPVPLATDVSGTLPAARMPALTGDVTSTVGTVATTIAAGAVTNTMLAGSIAASKLVGTDINTVGTITSGQWAGTPIPVAYGGTGASGAKAARSSLGFNVDSITTVGDADYSIQNEDRVVALNATLSAIRTWTLPAVAGVNAGGTITIVDSTGGISSGSLNYIQVDGNGSETINGSTNPFLLNKKFDSVTFVAVAGGWVRVNSGSIFKKAYVGSATYTTPPGVRALFVECIGSGGAGGGAAVASSNLSLGAGGSAGCYCWAYIPNPASSYSMTINPGGLGVSGGTGNNGSTTSFGGACTAAGGQGGQVLAAGTSAAVILGGGQIQSGAGDFINASSCGGAGIRLSGSVGISGAGGTGPLGGTTQPAIVTGNGLGAPSFGSGGAGGLTTGAAQFGGQGGNGLIIVTEIY